MRKAILSFIIVLTLMTPFSCYAYDESYVVNPEMWLENNNISILNIEDCALDGFVQYYADNENHVFYGHISHNADVNDNSVILVGLQSDGMNIEFDDSGITDDDFKTGVSYYNSKSEVYFAVDFKNKEIRSNTDFLRLTIRIDGKAYLVCDYISVQFREQEKLTDSKQTTVKTQKAGSAKQTTEKAEKSNQTSKKETTTKFKYTLNKSQNANQNADEESENAQTQIYADDNIVVAEAYESAKTEKHLSRTSKILLGIAAVFIFAGIVLMIHSCFVKNKDKSDKKDHKYTSEE